MSRRGIILGAVIFVATLAVAMVATELTLRAMDLPFQARWNPSENVLARFDPELGWRYEPGRSHLLPFGRSRRMVAIHIDADGNRAPRPGAVADPGRPTVLFVGGSFTFGHGLPYEDTFIGRLDGFASFPFQTVNLGVQAYGTDQALLRLREVIDRYRVVAVVYTFIEDHVVRNDNTDRRLIYPDARFLGTKPRFALDGSGDVVLRDRPVLFEDLPQSSLWNWIRLAWARRGPGPDPELTKALIRSMRRLVESHGAAFVLVHWRQDIEFPPGSGRRTGGDPSPILAGLDLDVVDVGEDAPAGWNDWVLDGDPHPDERAHLHVALRLLEEFRNRRLLEER